MISVSAAILVTHASASHVLLDDTHQLCKDAGYNVITTLHECVAAAKELKLSDTTVAVTAAPFFTFTPYGCYYEDNWLTGGLWFNPWAPSTSDGSLNKDSAICTKPDPGNYPTHAGLHEITSWDGTVLTADSETPVGGGTGKKYPLVVFMNSWGVPQIEYLAKTIEWAKWGYICVEYQTRGWYLSGGEIGTAGPEDIQDVSAVIDWAIKKFPVDDTMIAVGGVSYGGGISMLAAAHDSRIKAALVLSGWSDLFRALNWQNTPALQWGNVLEVVGKLVGNEPPILGQLLQQVLTHSNVSAVHDWTKVRSGASYLDQINQNQPAIYMSHQHGDNLFHSSIEMDIFEKLDCPKHMDVNQGTHASAELLGFIGLDMGRTAANHIWGQARDWLDHYLKGLSNGIPSLPAVQMQLGNDGILSDYVSFSSWPPASGATQKYAVGPRNGPLGTLSLEAAQNLGMNDSIAFSSKNVQMTTGTILVSDLIKDIIPITANLGRVDPAHAVVYATGALGDSSSTQICGVPRLTNLRVVPSEAQFQVVTFLYDLDLSTLKGRLITHGPYTVWADAGAQAGVAFEIPSIDMHTCCWDLKAGHALALGISMYDGIYQSASQTANITFDYTSLPTLDIPLSGDALPSSVVSSVLV